MLTLLVTHFRSGKFSFLKLDHRDRLLLAHSLVTPAQPFQVLVEQVGGGPEGDQQPAHDHPQAPDQVQDLPSSQVTLKFLQEIQFGRSFFGSEKLGKHALKSLANQSLFCYFLHLSFQLFEPGGIDLVQAQFIIKSVEKQVILFCVKSISCWHAMSLTHLVVVRVRAREAV